MFTNKPVSRMFSASIVFAVLLALALGAPGTTSAQAAGLILFVTPTGTGDCAGWVTACGLQTALTTAASGDEIWVAAGTYKPTAGTDRSATFQLKEGVALYGGFVGTETARNQRDLLANPTILSGDLLGDDSSTHNFNTYTDFLNYIDNSYHVVTANGVSAATILEGFTVKSGNADDVAANWAGGGLYIVNSSPTLAKLIVSDNYTVHLGGAGMYNSNSSPTLNNVTFYNNQNGTGIGGGLLNDNASHPTLTDVAFNSNRSTYGGGMANIANSAPILDHVLFDTNRALMYGCGMYNLNSSPTLTHVEFRNNQPYANGSGQMHSDGGGMYNDASSPTLTNSIFLNNSVGLDGGYGGGMYNTNGSAPQLTRVTFNGNKAPATSGWGGGIANNTSNPILVDVIFHGNESGIGGGMRNYNSSPVLTNVVFDSNTSASFGGGMDNFGGSPVLTNVTFKANTAADLGGALHNYQNSAPILTNVTISGNMATNNGGALANAASAPLLKNVILWGNASPSGEVYNDIGGVPVIQDSIIQGGCPAGSACTNILTGDPMLGALGDYGGFTQTIPLLAGSSAINTGNPAYCTIGSDQRGVSYVAVCDIGAYESDSTVEPTATPYPTGTMTATETLTPTPTPTITPTPWSTLEPFAGCNNQSQIPAIECEALVALYNSTGGANWSLADNQWLETNTICGPYLWRGVDCTNGHVTRLSLTDANLTGALPPELVNLTQLQYLKLSGNHLTGIPSVLGSLAQLQRLDLNYNDLTGIPPELGNLSQLTYLDLYHNALTGFIPPELGSLTQLTYLEASYNQLTGSIPPTLGNLTNLAHLSFYSNQLTGSIPPELGNLSQLTILALAINPLTGSIPSEFGNLTKIDQLSLGNTQLSGEIPTSITNLVSMTYLSLPCSVASTNPAVTTFVNQFIGKGLSAGWNLGCATSTPTPTVTETLTPMGTMTLTPTPTRTPTVTRTPTRTPAVVTLTFKSVGAQDGWVLESSENSNAGGSVNSSAATFNLGDSATKKQYRGILSFNTGAALPDNAVITGVTLKVKQQAILGGGNPVSIFGGFMFDVKNGFFGAAPALQIGDFQAAASQSYGPSARTPAGGWYSFNLINAKAYINKLTTNSGLTQIRLRFKLDDNNNAVANVLSLYSGNPSTASGQAAPAGSQPHLVITYILP